MLLVVSEGPVFIAYIVGFGLLAVIVLAALIWFFRHIYKRGKYRRALARLNLGMQYEYLFKILGKASSVKENGDEIICVWEQKQWKGILYHGNQINGIKVYLQDGRVAKVVPIN